MKTKITAIIMVLASSVFAFAGAKPEAQKCEQGKQPCAQQRVCKAPKDKGARPEISAEQRQAFVQRILLSLSDEELAKLADSVAAVQKMTAEEKKAALDALPKPEFRKGPKAHGPQFRKGPPQPRGHHPKARGPRGDRGLPPPPPPQQAPQGEEAPAPNADAPVADAPEAAPAAE